MENSDNKQVVMPGAANEPKPDSEEPCLPCLIPGITTAWNSARAACEFLPNDESKSKCRTEMEQMAKNIKEVKSAKEVIVSAIEKSGDPEAFIRAGVEHAKVHNIAYEDGIMEWAESQEKSGKPISEDISKIVKTIRATRMHSL